MPFSTPNFSYTWFKIVMNCVAAKLECIMGCVRFADASFFIFERTKL